MSFDLKIENNDISVGSDGQMKVVFNNEKLIQDVLKIIITPLGSNVFYKWYGCTLSTDVIGEVLDPFVTEATIKRSIEQSLNSIISLQQTQSAYQYVSPAESLAGIKDIYIERNEDDQRVFNIYVSVLTRKLNELDINFQLRI
jgi:hypothetical protein